MKYNLTKYSHGSGCGCKLSPGVLSEVLGENVSGNGFEHLLVGSDTRDDAAVAAIDDENAIVSTTDFFMPIVDDPHDFGAIAAANAISDIYAMAATPLMAVAILGWPIDKLPATVAREVIDGARQVCHLAGTPLAGGHSIDSPEPIFGLAVTGRVNIKHIRKNKDARVGDLLYLTKPLGIGIVTTAQKKKLAAPEDLEWARQSMIKLNSFGALLAPLSYVHAITDVTGFGLAGHLLEVCDASRVSATVYKENIPVFGFVEKYIQKDCIPGGTNRNWQTYGHRVSLEDPDFYKVIADPQTSGGLLITVAPENKNEFESFADEHKTKVFEIGRLEKSSAKSIISVCP